MNNSLIVWVIVIIQKLLRKFHEKVCFTEGKTVYKVMKLFLGCYIYIVGSFTSPNISHELNLEIEQKESVTKGIIDRMYDGKAVILLESEKKEIIVNEKNLPEGSEVNTWLYIEMKEEVYHVHSIDYRKTKKEKEKTKLLLQQLLQDK